MMEDAVPKSESMFPQTYGGAGYKDISNNSSCK